MTFVGLLKSQRWLNGNESVEGKARRRELASIQDRRRLIRARGSSPREGR